MRRFQSTRSLQLVTPAGGSLAVWMAESFRARLTGLAAARALPPGRALLLPNCAAVHTFGMRFALDVAFVSWPPVAGSCEVAALAEGVPPLRVARARERRRDRVAALEAASGSLSALGLVRRARLGVVFAPRPAG
jgi:uncharacterized membrane protein (UPF0127 family)